ncbi:MAG: LptA/OstA family protein [bacterium]
MQKDKLWVRHADSFEYSRYKDEETKHMMGNVHIEYDSVNIFADEMFDYLKRQQVDFLGNVRVHHGEKRIFADRAAYYKTKRELMGTAEPGNLVRVIDPGEGLNISGGRIKYYEETDSVVMERNPVLVDLDSTGTDSLRIECDIMNYSGRREVAAAVGNVTITRKDLNAKCGYAHYYTEEERICLADSPLVITENHSLKGNFIEMFLENDLLKRLSVYGNARGSYTEMQEDSTEKVSELYGDTLHSYFKNDTLQKTRVEHNAGGFYYKKENKDRMNTVAGRAIDINFYKEQVKNIIVAEEAASVYYFEEDIENNTGKNNSSGDTIYIDFEAGKVCDIEIHGGVMGSYMAAKKENKR